uniref:Uncharacterized protein At2g18870 n=1 Tax=Arabidopsis thaliana TaxID=3702 RepID=O64617_ARATH|nr:unknown protein [Arabidopsis thaliana]
MKQNTSSRENQFGIKETVLENFPNVTPQFMSDQINGHQDKPEKAKKNPESYGLGLEQCVKIIRKLECSGYVESTFRQKFLTWFSLRATSQERNTVTTFMNAFNDDSMALAEQLVDTFSDCIWSKGSVIGDRDGGGSSGVSFDATVWFLTVTDRVSFLVISRERNFADVDNLENCIKYLNQSLVTSGFSASLDLFATDPVRFNHSLIVSIARTCNCVYALIQQRQRDVEFRESANDQRQRLLSDMARLEAKVERLETQLQAKERELGSVTRTEAKNTAALKTQNEKLQKERDEFQRMVIANQV